MTEICVQIKEDIDKIKKNITQIGFNFVETYNNHDSYYTALSKEEYHSINAKNPATAGFFKELFYILKHFETLF